MAATQVKTHLKNVDGILFVDMFSTECIRETLQYKPQPGDLFIVTYPKCGTTWTQNIIINIFRKGVPLEDPKHFLSYCPYLEITGIDVIEEMPKPGAMKTHLPFNSNPYSPDAKYITVTRNPKDCCVSYYHHALSLPGLFDYKISFDEFFELFMDGNVSYGDYFHHTLSWYEHRDDPNVLYLTYEEMKRDTREAVLQIAKFLGEEYERDLRKDPEIVDTILKYSSVQYMKDPFNRLMGLFDGTVPLTEDMINDTSFPKGVRHIMKYFKDFTPKYQHEKFNIVRKGIVGDWRNYFSREQSDRMDERFIEKLGHTTLVALWKEDMKY